jgi:hypothetical protein
MIDRICGAISPLPSPWTSREATSTSGSGAAAPVVAARVNTAIPTTKSRRYPNRSPSRAAVISEQAKVSV